MKKLFLILSLVAVGLASTSQADTVTLNPIEDAFVYEGQPTLQYGGASTLFVGRNELLKEYLALLKFDLSAIPPGSVINSAQLRLYHVRALGLPQPEALKIYKATSTWTENTVNWNTRPPMVSGYGEAAVNVTPNVWITWDVTRLAREWLTASPPAATVQSLGVRGPNVYHERDFASREDDGHRPELIVDLAPPASRVEAGSDWRWFASPLLNTDWQLLSFSDAAWPNGPARLGFGDDGERTKLPSGAMTYYFRREFAWPFPPPLGSLQVRLKRDDGAIVYLNGTEIFRSNMPTGRVDSLTPAALNVSFPDETNAFVSPVITSSVLQPGRNIVAVEVHQISPNSSDLGFDLELLGNVPAPASLTVPVPAGWSTFANNFGIGGNTLNELLPGVADGTEIYKWNPATQSFSISVYDSMAASWTANFTLNPGEGAWMHSLVPQSITSATPLPVPPSSHSRPPEAGMRFVGCRWPVSSTFDDMMGFAPLEGDRMLFYEGSFSAIPTQPTQVFNFSNFVWSPFPPPLVEPGKAVFVDLVAVAPPTIVQQPQSQAVIEGNPLTLSVTATGSPPLSYSWRKNNATIAGETNSVLTIPQTTPNDAGNYIVLVSNAGLPDGVLSSNAVVTVGDACPLIICPPNITTNCTGLDGTVVAYEAFGGNPCNPTDFDIVCVPPSGSVFQPGTTTVHCLGRAPRAGRQMPCSFTVTVLSNCPQSCAPVTSCLFAWWRAEDNALDEVGGHDGTLHNGASFGAGRAGQAFSFGGLDDYVSVPDSPLWHFGMRDFTIELWTQLNQVKDSMFVHQQSGDSIGGFELDVQPSFRDGSVLVFARNPREGGIVRRWNPSPNTWYHLAVAREGGVYRLYVDGRQLGAEQPDPNPVGDVNGPLRIGSWAQAGLGVNGMIDELSIYCRALSASEIQAIYNAGSAGKCKTEIGSCIDITCPPNIRLPCAGLDGTPVEYAVHATNRCNLADLIIRCEPPSGSLFQPGKTTVRCEASGSGQTNSCAFTVEILQILPLHIVPFGPDQFKVWWLKSCQEPILEQSPSLSKPEWRRVPDPVQSIGEQEFANVPFDRGDPAMFFRVRPADPGEVLVALDQIAIVAAEGVSPKGLAGVAQAHNLTLVRELPGSLFLFSLPQRTDRAALKTLMEAIRQQNPKLIKQAGLVANPVGAHLPQIVTDEFIVQFHQNVDRAAIDALNAQHSVEVVLENPFWKNHFLLRATAASTADAMELSGRYGQDALVEYAEPNYWMFKDMRAAPNDPLFNNQWHLNNTGQGGGTPDADIDAPEAWDITMGSRNVVIAVLDSGFDVTHPDLAPNLWVNPGEIAGNGVDDDHNGQRDDINGWDFTNNDASLAPTPGDPYGAHGTAAAGCAGARGNNLLGVTGSCPNCRLMLVRTPELATAMGDALSFDYARRMNADIITCSWGYPIGTPVTVNVVTAINRAATMGRGGLGAVVFFAMDNGNVNGCGAVPDISSLPNVIAISRSNNRDRFDLSGFGNCMDLLAPSYSFRSGIGSLGITTTDLTGNAGFNSTFPLSCPPGTVDSGDRNYTSCFNGTSAATPITAGIAGLILSVNPDLTRLQIQQLLQDTADKIEDSRGAYSTTTGFSSPPSGIATHGYGRVNAFEAVRVVAAPALGGRGGADIFLRDNRLDWGNTEQPSYVLFEPTRGYIEHFVSVDIKIDAPPFDRPAPTTSMEFDAFPDENPIAEAVNRVFVRVHNRGPITADSVTVKLQWAYAGAGLPALPPDFWTLFPGNSPDTTHWHPLGTRPIAGLGYSGTSVAGSAADAAQIVQFDFRTPALDPAVEDEGSRRHHCLFAIIDSPQDPVSAASRASRIPDQITPNDNNVTHRNVALQDPTGGGTRSERFYARNPFDTAMVTRLRLQAPTNLQAVLKPMPFGQIFVLPPQAEMLFTVNVDVSDPQQGGTATILQDYLDGNGNLINVLGGFALQFVPHSNQSSNGVCTGFQFATPGEYAQPLRIGDLTFQVDRGFPDAPIRVLAGTAGGPNVLDAGFETVIEFARPCRVVRLEVEPAGSAMTAQAFDSSGVGVDLTAPVGPSPGILHTLELRGTDIVRVHLKAPMDQSYLRRVCFEE